MRKPHNIVVFYEKNCRRFRVDDPTPYLNNPHTAVNPDLSAVEHYPPQYWKYEGGFVKYMNEEERAEVDAWHKKHHQKNPKVLTAIKVEKVFPLWGYFTIAALCGIIIKLLLRG